MTNRAVRRQQAKEPKSDKGARNPAKIMAAPSTGAANKAAAHPRGIRRLIPRFALDIWSELGKVVWPKREDVTHLTFVIVVVTILIGAVLGLIDISFSWLIDKLILSKNLY
jgi:preprotein translocase SecE subunit